MAQTTLDIWLEAGRSIGAFQYILPFLTTFFIVFGLMEKMQPFGTGQSRVHGLLAAVIGMFVVVFAPAGIIGSFFSNFLGSVAVVLVALVLVMTGYGLVFGEPDAESSLMKGVGAIGAVAVIVLFLTWGGFSIILPSGGSGIGIRLGRYIDVILVLGLLGLLGWALIGGSSDEGTPNE